MDCNGAQERGQAPDPTRAGSFDSQAVALGHSERSEESKFHPAGLAASSLDPSSASGGLRVTIEGPANLAAIP